MYSCCAKPLWFYLCQLQMTPILLATYYHTFCISPRQHLLPHFTIFDLKKMMLFIMQLANIFKTLLREYLEHPKVLPNFILYSYSTTTWYVYWLRYWLALNSIMTQQRISDFCAKLLSQFFINIHLHRFMSYYLANRFVFKFCLHFLYSLTTS